MGARSKARKRALDVLFEADQRGRPEGEVLEEHLGRARQANPYVAEVVAGVVAHRARIDELLTTYAVDWPLDRMPAVDRAIARIGVYELVWGRDIPPAVAIDEAVELAKQLSTDESPAFLNGLLGRIATLPAEP